MDRLSQDYLCLMIGRKLEKPWRVFLNKKSLLIHCLQRATLEITYFKRGNFFLYFGDFKQFEPPPLTKGDLSFEDFSNPFDLQRLNQALKDEGVVDDSFFLEGVEYLRSIQKFPSYTRNPFKAFE